MPEGVFTVPQLTVCRGLGADLRQDQWRNSCLGTHLFPAHLPLASRGRNRVLGLGSIEGTFGGRGHVLLLAF